MDLFFLDKLVITFFRSLLTDPVKQFAALASVWLILEIKLPGKKKVNK